MTSSSPPEASSLQKSYSWRGQWIGYVCLLILAFFTGLPHSYVRMVGWPWIVIWQTGFLAFGIWLIWLLRQFHIPFRRLGHGLDWGLVFTVLVMALSSALAEFSEVAAWNFVLAASYGLLLYTLRNWIRPAGLTLQRAWLAIVLVGTVTSLISLALWRPDPAMWLSNDFYAAIRNPLPLGHHNFVGGYFNLMLPLMVTFALSQRGWKRWGCSIASFLAAAALYASGSRGAILGTLVLLLVSFGVAILRSRGRQRRRLILGSLLVLLAGTLILLSNPRIRGAIPIHWLSNKAGTADVLIQDGPVLDRYFMLQAVQNILQSRPLLGVGPGNLSRVYNLYRPIETGTGSDHVQQLHNTPAQIAGELGWLGIIAYLSLLGCLTYLWLRVDKTLKTSQDRLLLYGVGGSLLSYGVSSLTDYQLENIAIASTLTWTMALLIGLSDNSPEISHAVIAEAPRRSRRLLSLAVLILVCLAVRIWLPVDMAMYLSHSARQEASTGNPAEADQKWDQAARLTPWDPTYRLLAAENVVWVRDRVDADDKQVLTKQAIEFFERAIAAAPNDVWFNQNLAVLHLEKVPPNFDAAEIYASRTAQMLPRNRNYTFYLLGLIYLGQSRVDQAIDAFVLQGVVDPKFLTFNLWTEQPFSSLKTVVLEKTLASVGALLASIPQNARGFTSLNDSAALLRWWYRYPLSDVDFDRLSPIVKGLLQAEPDPTAALDLLNTEIEKNSSAGNLQLLRAWLDPETHLDLYLGDYTSTPEERTLIETSIQSSASTHSWLTSGQTYLLTKEMRAALIFAYRNIDMNLPHPVFRPGGLSTYPVVDVLTVFPEYPREFPQLDQLIETLKADTLDLPHPTRTDFRLISPGEESD